jgi:hypothetical protein
MSTLCLLLRVDFWCVSRLIILMTYLYPHISHTLLEESLENKCCSVAGE